MAHFELAPGRTSAAIAHGTVDEIWYILTGRGQMWRKQGDREEIVPLQPGVCVSIPAETHFQFSVIGDAPLAVIGVTMPPWPGANEARAVEGRWPQSR